MKSKIKQLAAIANRKTTAALIAASAFAATNANAGPLAEAFSNQVTDVKTDLYTVGGVVVGLVVVRVIFGAGIRLFNRAG